MKLALKIPLAIPSEEIKPLRPFLSIVLIIATLLGIVFLQMEERRMGYVVLKLSREQRDVVEQKRNREMLLAKVTRPQHVESVAQKKFTLRKVTNSQIIQLTGAPISVPVTVQKAGKTP